jgi:CoA:oxalate CoA-transferase
MADLTVLDVGNLTAGPLTSWLLGSLGADVIKVESPSGDHGRTIMSDSEASDPTGGYYFHSTNSDKQSVVLDLKRDDGRAALLDLVESSDVLVENFRPGTMASLGLEYETLAERNEALIYCSITGYGQDNAGAEKRAYDSILQALSGIMTATGYADDPPTKVGPSLVDNLGSYVAALAVVGALHYRSHTGQGQYVDVSMQDCAAWLMQLLLPFEPGRTSHQPASGPLAFNGIFEASDGWLSVAALTDADVSRLWAEIGGESAAEPERAELEARLAAWVGARETAAVAAALEPLDVFVGPVNGVEDVLADGHLEHRSVFESIEYQGEEWPIPVSPYVTAVPDRPRPQRGGPAIGEHTEEALADLAGDDAARIDELRDDG